MIVVDASAVVAILLDEPEAAAFIARLRNDEADRVMSVVNYWEVLARAEGHGGEAGRLEAGLLLQTLRIQILTADAEEARQAIDAFIRFGRRTPAGLNLGDCFAYALARTHGGGRPALQGRRLRPHRHRQRPVRARRLTEPVPAQRFI